MRLVTFDPFRTLGCPGVHYVKPSLLMQELGLIKRADFVLFPDYADISLIQFALGKTVFPSLSSYLLGYNKIEMTRAFQSRFPAHVPMTLILPNQPEHRTRIPDCLDYPFVAKLSRGARGEGVFLIRDEHDWQGYCNVTDFLYVQEKLDIDRDLRVVWIGDRIVHAYWRVGMPGGFQNNLALGGRIEPADIPVAAIRLVEKIAVSMGIDYAGFDIAMVGGHPFVFEFNRLFGLEGLNHARIVTGKIIHRYLQQRHAEAGAGDITTAADMNSHELGRRLSVEQGPAMGNTATGECLE